MRGLFVGPRIRSSLARFLPLSGDMQVTAGGGSALAGHSVEYDIWRRKDCLLFADGSLTAMGEMVLGREGPVSRALRRSGFVGLRFSILDATGLAVTVSVSANRILEWKRN